MSDDTPEVENVLPKYRLLSINADISITEQEINGLSKQGYELQAVSGDYMLMVLPSVDHTQDLITRMLEERYADQNPGVPPQPEKNDFLEF
jgi:hypothetical protein